MSVPMSRHFDESHSPGTSGPETATDEQLLDAFVQARDTAALGVLVRRHGPMVWGVCRRLLQNDANAEDAFQSTFLVLVRKAATIRDKQTVGNWLYGVARKVALKLRSSAVRQRTREIPMSEFPDPTAEGQQLWNDIQPVLDEELERLPAKFRAVIILCDLQGLTRKAAALCLGIPEGTVAGRLARGRNLLCDRLKRRGIVVTGSVLATLLSTHCAMASVPTLLYSATLKSACLLLGKYSVASCLLTIAALVFVARLGSYADSTRMQPSMPVQEKAQAAIRQAPAVSSYDLAIATNPRCLTFNRSEKCNACHASPVRPRSSPRIVVSEPQETIAAWPLSRRSAEPHVDSLIATLSE